jgi:hypothetical protein
VLTESEAWRTIGEAYEARVAEPELELDRDEDLADSGMCMATGILRRREAISRQLEQRMDAKSHKAVRDSGGYGFITPTPREPEGVELRATLAYLFAEATK